MKKILLAAALWFAVASVAGNAVAAEKTTEKAATTKSETKTATKDAAPKAGGLMVNINTATKDQLKNLKGVGDTRAQDIIDYRTKNGNFKSADDLEKVKGIGPGTMKQIRGNITVSGETMIPKKAEASAKAGATTETKSTKTTDDSKAAKK